MVPNLIWAPDFFGPREIWAPRNLDPEKFSPRMKIIICHFHTGTNILGAQISQGPNFLGPKFLGDQISWAPNFSGTISVIAL